MAQNQFEPIVKDFMFFAINKKLTCVVNLENWRFLENWTLIRTGTYLFNVSDANSRMCEICLKLTIKTPERRRPGVCFIDFELISLVVSLSFSIVDFK